jgi:hypothetical protein
VSLGFAIWIVITNDSIVPFLELLFLVWFVGFLVGVELLRPRDGATDRQPAIRWVMIAGFVVIALIVARRAIEILSAIGQ